MGSNFSYLLVVVSSQRDLVTRCPFCKMKMFAIYFLSRNVCSELRVHSYLTTPFSLDHHSDFVRCWNQGDIFMSTLGVIQGGMYSTVSSLLQMRLLQWMQNNIFLMPISRMDRHNNCIILKASKTLTSTQVRSSFDCSIYVWMVTM